METLGGPHAAEQKQTNGLSGASSVARRGEGGPKYTVHFNKSGATVLCCNGGCELANFLRHFWKTNLKFLAHLPCDYTLALPGVSSLPSSNWQSKQARPNEKVHVLCCLRCLFYCCAVLPDHPEAGLEDERCPLMTGCDRAGGQCVCDARHSCLGSFTYPDQETCMKASKSGEAFFPPIAHSCMHTHTHTPK